MERLKKEQLVSSLKEDITLAHTVILVHYQGLTVSETTNIRKGMRSKGAKFKIIKNSLAKLALLETNFDKIIPMLVGPTAIAYSIDPTAAAKSIVDFANQNEKLKILGGVINNNLIDTQGVELLAKLPSLEELRAKLIGVISAPATKIAGVLQAPAAQLVRVLAAYAKRDE